MVGVAGLLGSGRTEVARLMFGVDAADTGEILVDGVPVSIRNPAQAVAAGFGFCPEDRKIDGIFGDLSVRENIIIALQTTLADAARDGKPAADHLRHLVVHGILHLLGHDHQHDDAAAAMEALEVQILAGLGVADPYGSLDQP